MTDAHDPTQGGWPPPAGWSGEEPVLAPPPPPAATSRRRRTVLTAVAGVLVVGALGFGAATIAAGDGAGSPEGAVEALFDAIEAEDALGVVESMEPSERAILRAALEETQREAERVALASDDLDLRSVEGLDLEVEGLTLQAEELADGVVAVDIVGGRVSTGAELDQMPLGPTVRDVIQRTEEADEGSADIEDDVIELAGTRIVAVEQDGGWHVSVLGSLAEQIRLDMEPVPAYPDPASAIAAVGADSPEAAVREGIAAAVDGDIERLIELTPADEARVLHEYGPILVAQVADEDYQAEASDLELSVADAPDGRKVVSADSLTLTFADDDGSSTLAYDGSCTTQTYVYSDAFIAAEAEAYGDEFDPSWYPEGDYTYCDDTLTMSPFFLGFAFFASPASMDVVVEEHDGRWFLSPTRSLFETTIGQVRDLDADAVRRIARAWGGEWWYAEPAGFWEACGVEAPTLDTSRDDGEAAYERCWEQLPEDYEGPYGSPLGGLMGSGFDEGSLVSDEGDYEPTPVDECYEALAYEDEDWRPQVEACIAELYEQGLADEEDLLAVRCEGAYDVIEEAQLDDVDDDQLDALYEQADQVYDDCMAAGLEPGAAPEAPPPAPAPTPTTTTPNGPPSTTQPRQTTTSVPASTTTVPGTAPGTGTGSGATTTEPGG